MKKIAADRNYGIFKEATPERKKVITEMVTEFNSMVKGAQGLKEIFDRYEFWVALSDERPFAKDQWTMARNAVSEINQKIRVVMHANNALIGMLKDE